MTPALSALASLLCVAATLTMLALLLRALRTARAAEAREELARREVRARTEAQGAALALCHGWLRSPGTRSAPDLIRQLIQVLEPKRSGGTTS